MARYLSTQVNPQPYYGIRDVKPGYGTGTFRFYGVSGTFIVPTGVSEVRVTAVGAGGCGNGCGYGGNTYCSAAPGGGGGYIVATVPVNVGCTCNIAVGAAGGGASCFSTLVYAYGGCNGSGGYGTFTPGAGGNYCACSGSTLIVGRNGNTGCSHYCGNGSAYGNSGRCYGQGCCLNGGASGSPIGGAGTGPFPGTSSQDIFNCKGFNGDELTETCLATKFGNLLRWPGEAILGTSRTATLINGTAAGYPTGTYCVLSFGGAINAPGTGPQRNAGYGGGGSGATGGYYCYNNYGYGVCDQVNNQNCSNVMASPGNGFVVVEY
jgi:hypothetical protein